MPLESNAASRLGSCGGSWTEVKRETSWHPRTDDRACRGPRARHAVGLSKLARPARVRNVAAAGTACPCIAIRTALGFPRVCYTRVVFTTTAVSIQPLLVTLLAGISRVSFSRQPVHPFARPRATMLHDQPHDPDHQHVARISILRSAALTHRHRGQGQSPVRPVTMRDAALVEGARHVAAFPSPLSGLPTKRGSVPRVSPDGFTLG